MKLLAIVALLPSLAVAAPLLPAFDSNLSDTPGLSLKDAIDRGQRSAIAASVAPSQTSRSTKAIRPVEKKLVSRMPVIGSREVDPRMPIVAPDSSTEFKLAIVEPKVEPAH